MTIVVDPVPENVNALSAWFQWHDAQAQQLAVGTFVGASELARAGDEPPEVLRQRVTSKGGTTYAAITSMEQDKVKTLFMRAMHAAQQRARELGDEFGAD